MFKKYWVVVLCFTMLTQNTFAQVVSPGLPSQQKWFDSLKSWYKNDRLRAKVSGIFVDQINHEKTLTVSGSEAEHMLDQLEILKAKKNGINPLNRDELLKELFKIGKLKAPSLSTQNIKHADWYLDKLRYDTYTPPNSTPSPNCLEKVIVVLIPLLVAVILGLLAFGGLTPNASHAIVEKNPFDIFKFSRKVQIETVQNNPTFRVIVKNLLKLEEYKTQTECKE